MNILLDTNIYLSDVSFSKHEYEALRNYLGRTNSKIIVPEIIDSEVRKNLESIALTDSRALKKLSQSKIKLIRSIPTTERLTEALTEKYDEFLSERSTRISHPESSLSVLIQRSVDEMPPFKSEGKGFRDALIWLSAINYLANDSSNETTLAFISRNTKDFGKDGLLDELKAELESMGLAYRLLYFNDLNSFLATYGESIEFINDDFIETVLGETIKDYANDVVLSDMDIDYSRGDNEVAVVGWGLIDYDIEAYYIYRATSRNYYIYLGVAYTFEVELEVTSYDYDMNYEPTYDVAQDYARAVAMKEFQIKVDKSSHEVEFI